MSKQQLIRKIWEIRSPRINDYSHVIRIAANFNMTELQVERITAWS